MKRKIPQLFLALMITVFLGASASAATTSTGGSCPTGSNYLDLTDPSQGGGYGSVALSSSNAGGITNSCWYFSSSGSDSNTGTTEASPLQHLPGMPSCTGNCSSISPAAGTGFIIEGGSVYHRSSGSPLMGGNWTWSASGTSSNYIYIGVDPTWFSGASFARPILNQDNTLSTAIVSSCSFPDDGTALMTISGSFVIVDGLEATGNCMSGSGVSAIFAGKNGGSTVWERDYVHGWTSTSGVSDDAGVKFGPNNTGNSGENTIRNLFVVVDGTDSTNGASCATTSCVSSGTASGWGIEYGWDVEYSILRHLSNGIETGDSCTLIGSDLEYLFEPTLSGRHGNIDETVFSKNCTTAYFYNNVFANLNEGNGIVLQAVNYYIFNNVMFNDQHFAPDPNAWILAAPDTGSCPGANAVISAYFYNNTMQDAKMQAGTCQSGNEGGWASGSKITWENDNIMDFTNMTSFFTCNSGNSCAQTDNGGHTFMSTSTANSNGYTMADEFAPTQSSSSTVGKGNSAGSFCSSMPDSGAASACATGTGGIHEISDWGGAFAAYPRVTVSARASGDWDSGAYQYASGSVSGGTPPNPPTDLSAAVQ